VSDRRGARWELATGLVLLGLATVPTVRARPPDWELAWFQAVNDLPEELYRPTWLVMQLGALGAAPLCAAAALVAGNRSLARRLVTRGFVVWAAAKVVKRLVSRARPAALVVGARVRGREASGLGFPSGHAGVATALMASSLLSVDPEVRPVLAALAATVGAARVYVGAHLPLDVVGGMALGLCVDGALRLAPGARRQSGRAAVAAVAAASR
jgi:undecaprenyl-diphosphatase